MSLPTRCLVLALGGLAFVAHASGVEAAERILVSSPAFTNGGSIPTEYTCEGKGISPPLAWDNVPPGVVSVALTVDDPDAPKPPMVHWVLYNLPPETLGLAEAVSPGELPAGSVEGTNGASKLTYYPPCPPSGRHRYSFRVYALDTTIAPKALTMAELNRAMKGHVLARGELLGTYEKTGR